MSSYIIDGIWEAKQCILLGIILWLLWNLILFSLKKRNGERLKKYGFKYLFCELLLVIYLCTILTITGIIRNDISTYVYSVPNMVSLLNIPFKGASIKMVTLNCLLFAPYGFLIFILYGHKKKLSWEKAILIGFFTSLFIEIFQAFTGRLPEVDDLIANTAGFLVGYLTAQGFLELFDKKAYKYGIIRILSTVILFCISIFALSFWANGDALQAEEKAYYTEIGGLNFDKEYSAISKMNLIKENKVSDILQTGTGTDRYANMGICISNEAASYTVQNLSADIKTVQEQGKTYVEIQYAEPQTFRFYNNKSWEMKEVIHLLYCEDDGTIWYGTQAGKVENCAKKM